MVPAELATTAVVCRRNAVHVIRLAWATDPRVGFDRAGVAWLDSYVAASRNVLDDDMLDEFVQLMGCFYGECLIEQFDGSWARSGGHLGVRMQRVGFTYPFNAVARQIQLGSDASLAMSFLTAVDYVGSKQMGNRTVAGARSR